MTSYVENLELHVAGEWRSGNGRDLIPVENPADCAVIGQLPAATEQDIDDAIESSLRGFKAWSAKSAWARAEVLLRAAQMIADESQRLARILTMENGKPLADSLGEMDRVRETLAFNAEEAKRAFGRVYPPREAGLTQTLLKRPLGPVAAFAPWNFPAVLAIRKMAPALAAGCSVILKPAEECPATCIELVRILIEAGVEAEAINLLFGAPDMISRRLIAAPAIRKITFTGSIPVGKLLAEQAGRNLKHVTMELGGHAPVVIFDDVDVARVARICAGFKFRNAGQVCLAPSRFYVHERIYDAFLAEFIQVAEGLTVGPGFEPKTQMGPLASKRRLEATERLVEDAVSRGASVRSGGKRLGDKGHFYAPTVLTDLDPDSRILEEKPFCPVAPIMPFATFEEVIAAANRDDVGLSAYAFTNDIPTAHRFSEEIGAGWIGINDFVPLLADAPVAAHKESGFGYEGGAEGLNSFMETRFISQRASL